MPRLKCLRNTFNSQSKVRYWRNEFYMIDLSDPCAIHFKLDDKQTVVQLQLCPNEKCVLALVEDGAKGAKGDDVPNYITESSYTAMITGRKQGSSEPGSKSLRFASPWLAAALFAASGIGVWLLVTRFVNP